MKIVEHQPVRVGVVGCGVVAGYGHIPAIHRLDNAELVAFADPSPEARKREGEKYGLPAFESFEEMVKNVELDAVTIATQPDVKLDMIRIAAANGLHAFCEKPLTDNAEQAEELVRLMDEAGLFVSVAFVYRGKEVIQRMMQLVREGAIGKLRAVMIENFWDYHGLRDQALRGNRRRRALQNLGTLDCGVHDLDLARYMSGSDYADFHAVGAIVEKANIFPDHLLINGRMENGVIFSVEESAVWGYTAKDRPWYEQSYRMVGENGVLSAGSGDPAQFPNGTPLRVVSGEKQWIETLTSGKAWDETYRQFYETISGRKPEHAFVADGHDALKNMLVAREAMRQCGYEA
ncbi:MAG: Gfo/Idh/MocA family protein [Candidatus Sumerlaeota bacterium]